MGVDYEQKLNKTSLELCRPSGAGSGRDAFDDVIAGTSGRGIAGVGDVNGDGLDDMLIGAFGADSFAGRSYIVFGVLQDKIFSNGFEAP